MSITFTDIANLPDVCVVHNTKPQPNTPADVPPLLPCSSFSILLDGSQILYLRCTKCELHNMHNVSKFHGIISFVETVDLAAFLELKVLLEKSVVHMELEILRPTGTFLFRIATDVELGNLQVSLDGGSYQMLTWTVDFKAA